MIVPSSAQSEPILYLLSHLSPKGQAGSALLLITLISAAQRSAGAGGNHFPPCWNGVSYIFSLGSLLTGSVFVCVLSAGSETFLPRWGNNFWEIKSLNCANRLMRLWKVQSPISSFLLGKRLSVQKTFNWVREEEWVIHTHQSRWLFLLCCEIFLLLVCCETGSDSLTPPALHTF